MTKDEAAKFLNKSVASAIQGGVHQADIVSILEFIKFNLLNAHFRALDEKREIKFSDSADDLLEGGKAN